MINLSNHLEKSISINFHNCCSQIFGGIFGMQLYSRFIFMLTK
jgi:hypothetical protein